VTKAKAIKPSAGKSDSFSFCSACVGVIARGKGGSLGALPLYPLDSENRQRKALPMLIVRQRCKEK
jgi:hypothetical protein